MGTGVTLGMFHPLPKAQEAVSPPGTKVQEALGNVGECSGENHAQDFHRREQGAREGPSDGCKTCGQQPVSGRAERAEGTHVAASRRHLPAASLFPETGSHPGSGQALPNPCWLLPDTLTLGHPQDRAVSNKHHSSSQGIGCRAEGCPRGPGTPQGASVPAHSGASSPQRLKARPSPPSLLLENAWSSLPRFPLGSGREK